MNKIEKDLVSCAVRDLLDAVSDLLPQHDRDQLLHKLDEYMDKHCHTSIGDAVLRSVPAMAAFEHLYALALDPVEGSHQQTEDVKKYGAVVKDALYQANVKDEARWSLLRNIVIDTVKASERESITLTPNPQYYVATMTVIGAVEKHGPIDPKQIDNWWREASRTRSKSR